VEPATVERRLAAVLAADVVAYSRMVEADEASTLAAIRRLRSDVFGPLLSRHHGRVVKVIGDGIIAEFGSVVDAVNCAVAVQKESALIQAESPADRRIVLRIGVNLGDVVVEGDDLLGDGVNIAAAWSSLLPPVGSWFLEPHMTNCAANWICRSTLPGTNGSRTSPSRSGPIA